MGEVDSQAESVAWVPVGGLTDGALDPPFTRHVAYKAPNDMEK